MKIEKEKMIKKVKLVQKKYMENIMIMIFK